MLIEKKCISENQKKRERVKKKKERLKQPIKQQHQETRGQEKPSSMTTIVERVFRLVSSWKPNQDPQSRHYHLQQDLSSTTTSNTTVSPHSRNAINNNTLNNSNQIEIDQISNTSSTSELINLSAYPLVPIQRQSDLGEIFDIFLIFSIKGNFHFSEKPVMNYEAPSL